MKSIKTLLNAVFSLFFPDLCQSCSRPLVKGEFFICLHCFCQLPQTNYHLRPSNPAEELFRGKFDYEKISAFLLFEKGGKTQQIVHQIKYKNNKAFGFWCGQLMAEEMMPSGFFSGIDIIVPVPLHKKKQKKRGFNQAEAISRGIANKCNIQVDISNLQKSKGNTTQTKKSRIERWLNSRELFQINNKEIFSGKHILLIDDVVTTGSTLEACAQCIKSCKDLKISILTFAMSH